MSLTLYAAVAKGLARALRDTDPCASHHLFTVKDWQAEVEAGDTHLGYHDWLECRIRTALEDREIGFKDLAPPTPQLTLVTSQGEKDAT